MSAPPSTAQVVGNPDAAQDLYGLGVRVGFYLQALGMTLSLYSDPESYGKGLKIASGSITASVLASWFAYAALGRFSPSEAIVVLAVLIFLSFPAKASLLNAHTVAGETVGLVLLLLVELATCAALLWTFAVLVRTLPGLNTANIIWLVVRPVAIDGWFRYVALAYCAVDALTSLVLAVKVVRVVHLGWDRHRLGLSGEDQTALKEITEIIGWKGDSVEIHILLWLSWSLSIVIIELTVQKNGLSPSNDLQAPGQLIPLVTGIIILVDSVFAVGRRVTPHARRWAWIVSGGLPTTEPPKHESDTPRMMRGPDIWYNARGGHRSEE